jgi:hypothetical protein
METSARGAKKKAREREGTRAYRIFPAFTRYFPGIFSAFSTHFLRIFSAFSPTIADLTFGPSLAVPYERLAEFVSEGPRAGTKGGAIRRSPRIHVGPIQGEVRLAAGEFPRQENREICIYLLWCCVGGWGGRRRRRRGGRGVVGSRLGR